MLTLLLLLATAGGETRNLILQAAPPPQPAIVAPPTPLLVEWSGGEVRCDGAPVTPVRTVKPEPAVAASRPGADISQIELVFRIDAEGRPLDIDQSRPVVSAMSADLAPSLSLWRFEPRRERANCAIRFTPSTAAIATAPIEALRRFAAVSRSTSYGRNEVLARIRAGDCVSPRYPRVLLQGFPDYEMLPQESGTALLSVIGFDIGPDGKPTRVRVVGGDGNAALDRAAVAAQEQSRYATGDARSGCTMPFVRRPGESVAAPPPPHLASFRPAGATCPRDIKWASMPPLSFPEAFRRRAIEGWAVVKFDLAPWGQPGNVEVVASAPADIFADNARSIVMRARAEARDGGGVTGCVERVVFRIGREELASAP